MKIRYIYLSLIFLLIILNILIVEYFNKKYQKIREYNNQLNQEIINQKDLLYLRNKLIQETYKCSVSKNYFEVINHNPSLRKSLNSGKKVVLFFKEGVCGSCLTKIFQDLDILAKEIGQENIIVVTNWEKEGKPMVKEDCIYKHFLISESIIDDKNFNLPFVFVLGRNGKIELLFIPGLYSDYQQIYFSKILLNFSIMNLIF